MPKFAYMFTWFGYLSCFQFLAVTSKAAMNIHVEVCVRIYPFISLVYLPRSGIAGPDDSYMCNS